MTGFPILRTALNHDCSISRWRTSWRRFSLPKLSRTRALFVGLLVTMLEYVLCEAHQFMKALSSRHASRALDGRVFASSRAQASTRSFVRSMSRSEDKDQSGPAFVRAGL